MAGGSGSSPNSYGGKGGLDVGDPMHIFPDNSLGNQARRGTAGDPAGWWYEPPARAISEEEKSSWDVARKAAARASVDAIFGVGDANNAASREKMYTDVHDSAFDYNKTKLDEDRSLSDRKLRFALARSGLFGGSADIDQQALQQRTYDRGVLDVANLADQRASEARGSDESSRIQLLNQIEAGADTTSALTSANRALDLNAQKAEAAAKGEQIGNVFQNVGLLYDADQQAQGVAAARSKYRNNLGAFYNTPAYAGRTVN